jgi:hypothetical protein
MRAPAGAAGSATDSVFSALHGAAFCIARNRKERRKRSSAVGSIGNNRMTDESRPSMVPPVLRAGGAFGRRQARPSTTIQAGGSSRKIGGFFTGVYGSNWERKTGCRQIRSASTRAKSFSCTRSGSLKSVSSTASTATSSMSSGSIRRRRSNPPAVSDAPALRRRSMASFH